MAALIETRTATLRLGDDGVVRVQPRPHIEVSGDDARYNLRAVESQFEPRPLPFLIDLRSVRAINREARLAYTSPEAARIIFAMAFIVASPVSRIIGNLFVGLNQAPYPVRLFTVEAEALAWLRALPARP